MIALILSTLLVAAPTAATPHLRPYDAQHYKLEVHLGDNGAYKNTLTATLKATKVLNEIELDAFELAIEWVMVDGQPGEFVLNPNAAAHTGTLNIKPKKAIPAGKQTVVEVGYSGRAGLATEGFFTSTEDSPSALPGYFTHFEPNAAQRFFPCNDTPFDKATTEVIAVVDPRYEVISNGTRVSDEKVTEGGKELRKVQWKQDKPHSTYLVALAIAQLEPVQVSDDIPSTLWVPPGTKDRAFIAQDALKGLFNYETAIAGVRYPWARLDVVTVPRFYFGGMENTSAIFERTSLLLVDHKNDQLARSTIVGLMAHEMAHQWFGDLVTCNGWDETWLNESFATWVGMLALNDYNGADNDEVEVGSARRLIEGYFRQEEGPRAHALVVKGSTEEGFDAVTYTKGAHVLRMLDLWVGRAEMKKALKAYLEKHQFTGVTSDDFFKAVFESTKKEKELRPFKEAWLTRRGYPVIFPDTSFSGGKLTITIRQQPSASGEKGAFVFKLPIVVHRATEPTYTKEEVITVDKPEVKVTIDVPAAPQWINWNKNFGALARVNPGSLSEEQWTDSAKLDPDPVWRLVAARNLLGELANPTPKEDARPSDVSVQTLLELLQKDPSPYVREAILDKLADTRLKQLPSEFGEPLLTLAKRPEGLNDDPVGYIRVRRAAMAALARVDAPEGHRYLIDELSKREIDINFVGAFAEAVARIGTPPALATLRSAVATQKSRGMGWYRRTAAALGTVNSVDVISALRDVAHGNPGNNEVLRPVFEHADRNHELKDSGDYATFVRDFVLDEKTWGEDLRAQALATLDDVKYEPARKALTEVAEKATGERIKSSARRVLAANFPSAPAPATSPDKKPKK